MAKIRSLLVAASIAWSGRVSAEPQDSYGAQTSASSCSDVVTEAIPTASQLSAVTFVISSTTSHNATLPSAYVNSTVSIAYSAVTKTTETGLDIPTVTASTLLSPQFSTVDYTQSSTTSTSDNRPNVAPGVGVVKTPEPGLDTPVVGAPTQEVSGVLKTLQSTLDQPGIMTTSATHTGEAPVSGKTTSSHSSLPSLTAVPASAQLKTTQTGLYETQSTYASAVIKTTQTDLDGTPSASPGVKTPESTLGGPIGGYLPLPLPTSTTEHAGAPSVVTVLPTVGTYITAGAPALMASGTTYSLAPAADSIYVNDAASTVPPGNALTWSSSASAYVTDGATITAGAPAVVVSGTTYSLAGAAPSLYINGVAHAAAPTGLYALAVDSAQPAAAAHTTLIPWTAIAAPVTSTGTTSLSTAIVTPVPLQTSTSPGPGATSSPAASPSLAKDASDASVLKPIGGVVVAAILAVMAYT